MKVKDMKIDPIDQAIGAQLRQRRKQKHIPVDTLRQLIGVSPSVYYDYEKGFIGLTISKLITLCDYLGLNYDEVIQNAKAG